MFHVELRRFPHVARIFNLAQEDVEARIVTPLVRGVTIELDDRRWTAEKTRMKIYEAPEVAAEDRGLGRGWSIVTREGMEVTSELLEAARARLSGAGPEGIQRDLLAAAAANGIALSEVVARAARGLPGRRASEALAVAEQAVWELLHAGSMMLVAGGSEVPAERWETVLLAWESWQPSGEVGLRVRG